MAEQLFDQAHEHFSRSWTAKHPKNRFGVLEGSALKAVTQDLELLEKWGHSLIRSATLKSGVYPVAALVLDSVIAGEPKAEPSDSKPHNVAKPAPQLAGAPLPSALTHALVEQKAAEATSPLSPTGVNQHERSIERLASTASGPLQRTSSLFPIGSPQSPPPANLLSLEIDFQPMKKLLKKTQGPNAKRKQQTEQPDMRQLRGAALLQIGRQKLLQVNSCVEVR